MAQVITSLLLCHTVLLLRTLGSPLVAEPGENVTFWCQHDLTVTGYIFLYKQPNTSVPLLFGCKQYFLSNREAECPFSFETKRILMSMHNKNISFTIISVDLSDTGLYYCGFSGNSLTTFSNARYLEVKDRNEAFPNNSDRAKDLLNFCSKGCISSGVFFMLTGFVAVIVILLCILIVILLKRRKTHTDISADLQINEDPDSLNFAALQFSNKKTKRIQRRDEMLYTCTVYAAVRQ